MEAAAEVAAGATDVEVVTGATEEEVVSVSFLMSLSTETDAEGVAKEEVE